MSHVERTEAFITERIPRLSVKINTNKKGKEIKQSAEICAEFYMILNTNHAIYLYVWCLCVQIQNKG